MKRISEMKKISPILLLAISTLALTLSLSAQKDPAAVKVLTDFSKKASSAPSVKIDFTLVTDDSQEGTSETISGSAVISGDKYVLDLPDNKVWSDGKTVWSYLPDVNEVTITEPDPDDKSFASKPSLLFSLYEEGYKIRLLEQTAKEWVIDLYPEDISVNMIRIRLRIGKSALDLKSAEYRTKDGITVTLTTSKYDLTYKPDKDYFVFDPAGYKDIDVIDMR
jgi:outer membrane lipoprotein carrier protein